jgi:hypothetical protein
MGPSRSLLPGLIALARVLNTSFFFVTSVYCLLAYSPFTYQQFIKPNVSAGASEFAVWHAHLHVLVLSITALTLAPYMDDRARRGPAWLGWSYLGASVALGVWLFMNPLWLMEGTSRTSLILAIASALPPVWLAVFDHVALRDVHRGARGDRRESHVGRLWTTCWMTGAFVFGVYALAAPLRLQLTGGIALSFEGMLLAWTVSALAHLTAFTLIYLVLVAVRGLAVLGPRSPGQVEYWLLWAVSAAAIALVLVRVMLAPIAIRGPAAWIVSTSIAVALVCAWSGVAQHRIAGRGSIRRTPDPTALDAWLAPIAWAGSRRAAAIGLVIAPVAVHLLIARVATFDWEFMLQKLATLGLWLAAFGFMHALTAGGRPARAMSTTARTAVPVAVIALFAAAQVLLPRLPARVQARVNPEFALDGYAAVDPSFRIAQDMLVSRTSADAAAFYAYLRANTEIQDPRIEAVDIDFAHGLARSSEPPPNVFLLIIDSLRRDYVSPYNAAVSFTPAIGAFASDSFVFKRAFSRYGGTGLSVPAIWAGSMVIHKQYVTPFAPTNALEKLLDANAYRRLITEDHITEELFAPSPETTGLDHNIPEMLHTFCRTVAEIGRHLEARRDGQPLFVMTRPLDLHIGNVASAKVPPGESYPGFHGPYAARVRRIDACFGELVSTLKRLGLYDNSIIVITSDHGDSLGEGQRWGHGFTAFPEVLRIPLIIHLPPALRSRVSADLARVSFSTDITPTLYALLGESIPVGRPRGTRDLLTGSPLFVEPSADLSWRRRESYLVASSYGPVFGLLGRNGGRLYVTDAVENREYAYDLGADGMDVRVGITDAERQASRNAIREQIAELAAWYRYKPEP